MLATFSVNSFDAPTNNLSGIVADDFNVDGNADVAVTTGNGGAAYVAFGNGSGSLGGFATYGTGFSGSDVFAIAAGNLQGSSAPELVVTGFLSGTFRILANNGAGGFLAANAFGVGSTAEQPVIADMNGDGSNDVIVGRFGSGGVSVTYMDGAGAAIFGTTLGGPSVTGVTVGDFNGDGRRDIAAAGFGSNVVYVYLNQGQTYFPSFTTTSFSSSGTAPIGIVSADLDGDSDLDLAVTNRDSNTVVFFSNNGAGVFTSQGTVGTGGSASSTFGIEAGDLDRDGDRDVVVALRNENQIRVLRNNGGFNFVAETPIGVTSGPFSVDIADFNNDRRLDIAVGHQGTNAVTLLLNTTPAADVIDVSPDPRSTAVSTVDLAFNGPINAATFDHNDLSLTLNGGPNLIAPAVTVVNLSGNTYRISGLSLLTAANGNYQLSVNLANVQDAVGQLLPVETVSDTWTKTPPITVSGTAPSLTGGTLASGATSLAVTFSQNVTGANKIANYELRSQGPNGLLGDGDDPLVNISSATYVPNTATLSFLPLAEGVYRLTVQDAIADLSGNALDGDANGTAGGNYVRDFVVAPSNVAVPYRWQTFNTYDNATGWLMGNNASMYGGVNPSSWTDAGATAQNMSSNLSALSTLFTNKGYADKNAMIWSEVESTYSYTNGEIGAALFRIQNTTGSAINWNPQFYYSSYGNWGEWASVAVNGVNVWTSSGANTLSSISWLNISIPANSTSTVIFTSSLGPPACPGAFCERAGQLGFFNNSLQLPAGLAAIDDLPASVPYRWQTFNTYDNATSWLMGNNSAMYGGVSPSQWTDGSATAANMSTNLSVLSTLFTNKGYADKNAMIWSEVESAYSSTNGEIGAALFRIQNTTGSAINWNPQFYYSSFGSWNEWASVAVNGVNVWTSGANTLSSMSLNISIPANSTSTVIFTSSLGPSFCPDAFCERAGQLGFFNNSLQLPTGLAAIDDVPASVPYRWQTFNTYDNAYAGWLMGNNSAMYGGVSPSQWTDGSATAANMSTNLSVLSTLFTNKGYADKNAMIWSEVESAYSSTNGEIGAALFRIQNTTGSAINWNPQFYYSSFGSWNEWASVAVNGVNVWTSGANTLSSMSLNISIPANSTSTVIFTSSLGPSFCPDAFCERAGQLGFFNNSLQLPAGLAAIDDLNGVATIATLASPGAYQFDVDLLNHGSGQLIQGSSNAFDGLNRLQVSGVDFSPSAAASTGDGGRTIVLATQTHSGLNVSREVTVPSSGSQDFARTLDVFSNPTVSPITVPVKIVGNLGSDGATSVFNTSDGDSLVETTDRWIGTDDADGTGTPAIVHYIHGFAGLAPTSIIRTGDNIEWTYNLTVPAGQTVRLAHFTVVATGRVAAETAANTLVTPGGFGGQAAASLTHAELDSLANFAFNVAPTDLSLAPSSVAENQAAGTVVGDLSSTDPNLPNDSHTYTLVDTANYPDNARFTVVGSQLQTASVFDFETTSSYTLKVRTTDAGGLWHEKKLVVAVTNANEAPVANAGGSYVVSLGDNVVLDGTGSWDPDVSSGDSIAAYAWDLWDDGSFEYAGASSSIPAATLAGLPLATSVPLRLRVTDGFGLTAEATTSLVVYDSKPRPVIVANPSVAPINVSTGLATVDLDAHGTTHGDPRRANTVFEWDLDEDGQFDDATGVFLNGWSFPWDLVPQEPVNRTVAIRVTDDAGISAVGTTTINFRPPPTPPMAFAGGPYVSDVGQGVTLNGTGSFDPDQPVFGDYIARAQWDLNNDGTYDFTFADGADTQHPATLALTVSWNQLQSLGLGQTATPYPIRLRVSDYLGLSHTASATLRIYDNRPSASLTASPNPGAPAQVITLDASGSSHGRPDRSIVSYAWDFGDGTTAVASTPTIQHAFAHFGLFTVSLTVTDNNVPPKTNMVSQVVNVNQGDHPPVANVGGPYQVPEGGSVALEGSASTDPDLAFGDSIVSYDWDLDGDGQYDDATGPAATFLAAAIDGPAARTVGLRATDSFGLTGTGTATVTVNNVAPTVNAGAAAAVRPGVAFTRGGSFTDPGADTWSATVDYGDGTGLQPLTLNADKTFALSHVFPAGSYSATVTVTVTDDDSGVGSDTVLVQVDNIPPTVTGTSPSLDAGTLLAGATSLQITFSETVAGGATAANYQFQSVGPDTLLGTADDTLVPLTVSYTGTTGTLHFDALPPSVYRLTVRDNLTDGAGNALDGDGNGLAGGARVIDFVVIAASEGAIFYGMPTFYTGASGVPSIATGDFNRDGLLDLAVTNQGSGSSRAGILLNRGDGTFAEPITEPATTRLFASSVTTGDFNGDGILDLATTSSYSDFGVLVNLGRGDGTFDYGPTLKTGGLESSSVTTGDFNGDGRLDLAVANSGSNNVGVLLGHGDGTFLTAVAFASGGSVPRCVATGDFDGDGHLDLAVANFSSGSVGVLLGRGDGTFEDTVSASSGGSSTISLATGDFNGDGRLDIAAANSGSGNLGVLFGHGDGTFANAATVSSGGSSPSAVTTRDLNGDGRLDLAVTNAGGRTVGLLRGNGDGTFADAVIVGAGVPLHALSAGDFNADGRLDLAVATDSRVGLLLAAADGTFPVAPMVNSGGSQPRAVSAGDFNGDGHLDVAVANGYSRDLGVVLGHGDGTFAAVATISLGSESPTSMTSADFNSDGHLDLAVAKWSLGTLGVLLGHGDGTFAGAASFSSGGPNGSSLRSVIAGDFNGDGYPDLVVANFGSTGNLGVLLGRGDGTFAAAALISVDRYPGALTTGDFNSDGRLDLAVSHSVDGTVSVLLGRGDGTFQASAAVPSGTVYSESMTTGDFNGDGDLDLAVGNGFSVNVGLLFGHGDGTFAPYATLSRGYPYDRPGVVTSGDFNGDGRLDLAVNGHTADTGVFLGRGDGTFASAAMVSSGDGAWATTGDFNADGRLDLAVANSNTDSISILLNIYALAPAALYSAHGLPFDIQTGGYMAGQLLQGPDNAFDGLNRLQVSGVDFSPSAAASTGDGGRTIILATQTHSGLNVSREVTVPSSGSQDFARTLDVFSNPTVSPITVPVKIVGNLGSDGATTVFNTSDGDNLVETTDQWIGTDDADGTGTPAIVHYIHGPNGIQPSSVQIIGDNIVWEYNLTVPAGQTVRLAHFAILDTSRAGATTDANALVTASGFGGEAAAFLTSSELGSLANFQFKAKVEFSASTASDAESTGGNFPKLLVKGTLAAAETIDVTVTGGSATAGTDFTNTATITIPSGTYDGTLATAIAINLSIANDNIVENNETIQLTLANPSFSLEVNDANADGTTQSTHTYTIKNDDTATLSISAPTITETDVDQTTLTFTVGVDAAVQGGFQVAFSDLLSGTATVSTDYTVDTTSPLSFTGTAGESHTISITIKGDDIVEANETFTLQLGDVTDTTAVQDAAITTAAQATATITNDDTARLSITAPLLTETDADQTTLTFAVGVDAAVQGGFQVAFSDLLSGTATVSTDYTVDTTSPLSFTGTAGESHTISITIKGDDIVEANETFTLQLGDVTNTTTVQDAAISTGVVAVGGPDFGFALGAGGTGDDAGYRIALATDGSVYTTGRFSNTADFDPGAGTFNLSSAGDYDIFVAKYSATGALVWAHRMGGTGADAGYGIAVAADGSVYTTGRFSNTADFDPGAGTFNLSSAGINDIFVSKLDSAGNFIWARRMGATGDDYGTSMALATDGSVYTTGLFGQFSGTVDFDPGAGTSNLTSTGGYDIFVSKLDSAGNFVWARRMGGTGSEGGDGIAVAADGSVYSTGWFYGTADFDPGAGTFNLTSAGVQNIFVSKLDSAGNFVWARSMGGTTGAAPYGIGLATDGSVYTTGWFSGTADFDPGAGTFNLTSAGQNDVFVSKLDSAGNFVWARRMGGTSNETAYGMAVATDGSVYTTGLFDGTTDFDPSAGTFNLTSAGLNDIFVSKLDSAGNFVWARSMGGTGADNGNGIAVAADGSVYTAGQFHATVDFDPGAGTSNLTSAGSYDAFVSRLLQPTLGISAQATATITNDDTAGLSIAAPLITETDVDQTTLTFTVGVDAAVQGGFQVAFSDLLSGTATVSTDYTVDTTSPLSFTGTASESHTISITIKGDDIVEASETFTLQLGDVTDTTAVQDAAITTAAQATATITNDDTARLSITAPLITETDVDQTTLTFTVGVDAAVQGGFQVAFSDLLSGTATVSTDYTVDTTSPLSFTGTAGESHTISITIKGDDIVEANETFTLQLGDVTDTTAVQDAAITTGAQATATIANDDTARLSITAPLITETDADQTTLTFTVGVDAAVQGGFQVAFSDLLSGTATVSTDYTVDTTSPLSFTGTAGESHTISITIKGDDIVEANETFTLQLGDVTDTKAVQDAAITTGAQATATITNDDTATLAIDSRTITEGDSGTQTMSFTVTSLLSVQGGFTLAFSPANVTATMPSDYFVTTLSPLSFSGTVGETRTISVAINGDTTVEPDETFKITLGAVSDTTPVQAAAITSGAFGTGTIIDNDTATTVGLANVQYSDTVTLSATISTGMAANLSGTMTFSIYVGGSWIGYASASVTNQGTPVSVNATTSQVLLAPAAYSYKAEFKSTDAAYSGSTGTGTLTVAQENAQATYVGPTYVSTPNATTNTAVVPLQATIVDDSDGFRGNVDNDDLANIQTNAKVTFKVYDVSTNTLVATFTDVLVNLINPADPTIGTAIVNWTANINSADSVTYKIRTIVNNFYTRDSIVDDELVTVAKPLDNSITGGGYIINTDSAGQYAADDGRKTNFGFNVKFNKSGTNPQGKINIIFRRLENDNVVHVYQIKSTSIRSLGVNAADGTSTFLSKANLTDVTNPALPISLGGNLDLTVKTDDNGEPGSGSNNKGNDKISVTLYNGPVLWFSSNWNGVQSRLQVLDGGNLRNNPNTENLLYFVKSVANPTAPGDQTVTEGNSGTQDMVFTVKLSQASDQTVTVNYSTADNSPTAGAATAGLDYVSKSSTLTFVPGVTTQTITVKINGDVLAEPKETFSINLSNPVGAGIQVPTAVGLILDNDLPAPLHVLGGAAAGGENVDALGYDAVQPLLAVAIEQWRAPGADPLWLNSLAGLQVRITDLPDSTLGLASQELILLDRDAAGYGWSFSTGAPRSDRVDLLSALTHEVGHLLGLDHDVMGESLVVGARMLPSLDYGRFRMEVDGVANRPDASTWPLIDRFPAFGKDSFSALMPRPSNSLDSPSTVSSRDDFFAELTADVTLPFADKANHDEIESPTRADADHEMDELLLDEDLLEELAIAQLNC